MSDRPMCECGKRPVMRLKPNQRGDGGPWSIWCAQCSNDEARNYWLWRRSGEMPVCGTFPQSTEVS